MRASSLVKPVNLGLVRISVRLPYANLAAHLVNGINPANQALARHDADLRFGHVQPAAVLGRVHEFETIPKRFGLVRLKRLVQRTRTMGVQIVHHQGDGFGRRLSLCNIADKVCEIALDAPLGHLGHARSDQRLGRNEHVAGLDKLFYFGSATFTR